MKDRVDELLDIIGLERNTIQTVDGDGETATLFFPNFMSTIGVQSWISDSGLLDVIIELMEEHAMDVATTIKMARRYRKSFEGSENPTS